MRLQIRAALLAGSMLAGVATVAGATQCLLMNPSFEIAGSSGNVFAGWSQFGTVDTSRTASHGSLAARVTGPNTGAWTVSGFWQGLDSSPGDTWKVSGTVRVPSSKPLAGQSTAIVNVEWRNSGGTLISYESHTVATAGSPKDSTIAFEFTTGSAPAGTASARLLLGNLQGPSDPPRDVIYDQARFEKQTVPSIYAGQWADFPGGRTLSFAGRTWRVKGTGYYGPGPSVFSDDPQAVWVDGGGSLHLTVAYQNGNWNSTEMALTDSLGYGDYVFTTRGQLDALDPAVVLGLFIWEYGPCYDASYLWWNPYNEVDVEFSHWGVSGSPIEQFVAQPSDWGGNLHRFTVSFSPNEVTSHAFRWRPDRVEFRSWRGDQASESPATMIQSWTYAGPHVPRPDRPRTHVNLWQYAGAPATGQEVVLDGFTFTPWPSSVAGVGDADPVAGGLRLRMGSSSPSRWGATLSCSLPRTAAARVDVFDPSGRRVRTVFDGSLTAGPHEFRWDGTGAAGTRMPSGVYVCRLATGGASATARVVLLR